MIECVDQNICYKKRQKKGCRFFKWFVVICFIFLFIFYYNSFIVKNVSEICKSYLKSYADLSVNNAVIFSLNNNLEYSDLVKIEKNNNGDIVLMSANSYYINKVSRQIIDLSKTFLDKNIENGIEIPLFAFSGIRLFSGYGPKIKYKNISISSVNCSFKSDFISSGINQTIHKVYADIEIDVDFIMLFSDKSLKISSPIMLVESVIVGKVPDIYLNRDIFNK